MERERGRALTEVLGYDRYKSNADLIVACRQLGYLHEVASTLDVTYGLGVFWKKWQPIYLVGCDINPERVPEGGTVADFRCLPFDNRSFDCVVYDPPYRLNGEPDPAFDERYGTDERTRWQDRMDLIELGFVECERVLGDGFLLVKCQDQVVSGKIRWQTTALYEQAKLLGLGQVDRLDKLGGRKQPGGRKQKTARRNSSSMLVFKRGWRWHG